MRTTYVLRTLVVGALVLTGCAKDGEDPGATTKTSKTSADEDGNSETGGATTSGTTGVDPSNPTTTANPSMSSTPTTVDPPETTAGETADETGKVFLVEPDGGGADNECDIWMQDCPEGEKCMPWANDGGGSWNATKCTPVDANAKTAGDECVADGGTNGIDNCEKGLICWFLNPENVGTCIEMCTGSPDNQNCPNGKICDESNEGVIIICLETCDPLAQSCPEDQICFFDGVSEFICDFDASGEEGQYGDPCAFINVCDYGLFCASQQSVPGCESADGCCSTYCDITLENTCPGKDMMQECVPWYGEGQPTPPGQENIGACALPE